MKRNETPIQSVFNKKLIVSERDEFRVINQGLIIRVEADRSYSLIYFIDGSTLLISKTLKEVEAELSPLFFLRTHRSHLINISEVKSITKNSGCRVRLTNGDVIPVTMEKVETLFNRIRQFE